MRLLLMSVIIFHLYGCATTLSPTVSEQALPNIRIYDYNFQDVFDKLLEVTQELKIPTEKINKNKGIVACQRLNLGLDEFRKIGNLPSRGEAGGFKQPWLWARYMTTFQIQSIGNNQTKVIVKIHLEGYNASGARWVTIISNGSKEREILDILQARLNQKDI